MSVILETSLGDIVVDLYTEERRRSCMNFLKLCKVKYYNYCLIHTVQRGFLVQMGDPTGTGRGGESIFCKLYGEQAKYFEAEPLPKIKHRKVGTLSMVNNGNGMHGSQFFITTGEDLDYLDGVHTVFGEVSEGMNVLMSINDAICDEQNRPYKDIRLNHTIVLHDPFDDLPGLDVPNHSPRPTEEQLKSDRIGVEEDIADATGKSMEEIEEEIKEKEAKARATILEMVGDLPDSDAKPLENVLFVCKLNPVTTDEDLEIIFSRFGQIKSCEIIRDSKSGESLQYAFIEFEKKEDCENAYFKMDNVLIDDRRIHVDFSQSVAHLRWKGKRPLQVGSSKGNSQAKFIVKEQSRPQGKYQMIFDDDTSKEKNHANQKLKSGNSSSDEERPSGSRPKKSYHHSPLRKNQRNEETNASDLRKLQKRNTDASDRQHSGPTRTRRSSESSHSDDSSSDRQKKRHKHVYSKTSTDREHHRHERKLHQSAQSEHRSRHQYQRDERHSRRERSSERRQRR